MQITMATSVRTGLIAVLALLGVGLAVRAILEQVGAADAPSRSARLLVGLRGFRLTVIGLALLGVAGGWFWGATWLVVLSLGIAGEETFESSVMIWGLEREQGRGLRRNGERPVQRAAPLATR